MKRRKFLVNSLFSAMGSCMVPSGIFALTTLDRREDLYNVKKIYPSFADFNEVLKQKYIPRIIFITNNKDGGIYRVLRQELSDRFSRGMKIVTKGEKCFVKLRRIELNIRQFGAVGNGVIDDTDAVEKAFKFLKTNSDDYTLIFPEGEYPMNAHVEANNVYVKGKGVLTPTGKRKNDVALLIKGDNNTVDGLNFYEKRYSHVLLEVNGNGNTIVDCNFYSSEKAKSDKVYYSDKYLYLSKDDGTGNVIKKCKVNNGRTGIGLQGSSKVLNSEISNCITGIIAHASTQNTEIAHNIIRDNNVTHHQGADGILALRNVSKLHIHNNEIYNSGEHGIYFQGDNSIIENNNIHDNFRSGIKLASYNDQLYKNGKSNVGFYIGHNNVIKYNKCYDNSKSPTDSTNAGIYLQAPLRDIEVDHNISYNNYHGIRSTSKSNLKKNEYTTKGVLRNIKITNNKVYNNKGRSLYIEGETGIVITDNEVDDILTNAKSPAHKMKSPLIRGNTVRKEMKINRAENCKIENNNIETLTISNNSDKSAHRFSGNQIKKGNKQVKQN